MLTDVVVVFGHPIFDISGFADALTVFGNVIVELYEFTDAVVVLEKRFSTFHLWPQKRSLLWQTWGDFGILGSSL